MLTGGVQRDAIVKRVNVCGGTRESLSDQAGIQASNTRERHLRFIIEEATKERSCLPVARMTDMASSVVLVRLTGDAVPV